MTQRAAIWEYFKQIFWSSGVDLNKESFASLSNDVVLDALELPPTRRRYCLCNCGAIHHRVRAGDPRRAIHRCSG